MIRETVTGILFYASSVLTQVRYLLRELIPVVVSVDVDCAVGHGVKGLALLRRDAEQRRCMFTRDENYIDCEKLVA